MPVTWTQADIDALKAAVKTGTKTVKYADREVTYHSLDEMLKLLTAMQDSVDEAESVSGSERYRLIAHRRGT